MIGMNEHQQILDLPGQPSLVRLIRPSPEGFDSRMRLPRLSQHLLEVVLPEIRGATIVFDHFHLIKLFNDRLSDLRRGR